MPTECPPFRVRYADTDAQAVAYYASYFTWQEVGFIHFLEAHDIRLPEHEQQGSTQLTVETYARFRRPAAYDDLLVVRTRLAQAAPKRLAFENEIIRVDDGELLALGRTAHVWVDAAGEVAPIPETLLRAADERVERITISERAEELLGPAPPGARQCTRDIKVRYAETDSQGVAYFGSYYAWFEAGRNELTRSLGLPYSTLERRGIYLPVAQAFCRHFAPLRACETFRMTTAVPVLGHARLTFTNRMAAPDGKRQIAAGYTIHGCTGRDGRPHGLPPEIVERFSPAT